MGLLDDMIARMNPPQNGGQQPAPPQGAQPAATAPEGAGKQPQGSIPPQDTPLKTQTDNANLANHDGGLVYGEEFKKTYHIQ